MNVNDEVDYIGAQKYARPAVMNIVRSVQDCEDVLQDATVKAILRLDQFRGDCQFRTWYCRIAITTALMRLRRRHDQVALPFDLPSPEPSPDATVIAMERSERLYKAVKRLPPALREEFPRYLAGEPGDKNSVKSNRFRIRNRLRVALEGTI